MLDHCPGQNCLFVVRFLHSPFESGRMKISPSEVCPEVHDNNKSACRETRCFVLICAKIILLVLALFVKRKIYMVKILVAKRYCT